MERPKNAEHYLKMSIWSISVMFGRRYVIGIIKGKEGRDPCLQTPSRLREIIKVLHINIINIIIVTIINTIIVIIIIIAIVVIINFIIMVIIIIFLLLL